MMTDINIWSAGLSQQQVNHWMTCQDDPGLEEKLTLNLITKHRPWSRLNTDRTLTLTHCRVDDWFLMSSPWPTVALCLLYYYIIRVAGPRFMKDREPLNIQNLVVVYNLFQVTESLTD